MIVVIMAGGKGTRIASVNAEVPKPMLQVGGKPVLVRQIEMLQKQGVTEIILVTGYLHKIIENYFGTRWKLLLRRKREKECQYPICN